jgi:single-stranded-DNA-specific exonuclease
MLSPQSPWQLKPQKQPPDWLLELLHLRLPQYDGRFIAQILTQRGIQDADSVLAFLDSRHYQPTPPSAFGVEMEQAVARLIQARDRQETVFIWGDFDADGITATAVLWEGLGQFFQQEQTLRFFIPNRLKESHGLSIAGIEAISAQGAQLIVTCDTGSSDHTEIDYAQTLGIDIIITDHHTFPQKRPSVAAFLNSRTFSQEHPLANLSGVAVAYKLIEALYEKLPQVPQSPLEDLLDLVAIGLIADLVQLTGDCRYLAQKGLLRLKQQIDRPTRPGVAKLLELCRRTGDRPSDISFGLGPRINALSRIHGDAREGVELLTTQDPVRAAVLAESAEVTNLCRKEVQQRVTREAEAYLARLDLESTSVIVLSDPQWPVGVLGLVASQLAQTHGRPAILLSTAGSTPDSPPMLRGSARSVRGIDLYTLLQQQTHLLDRFGGHPFAAGLSLRVENLPLLKASINQCFRQTIGQWTPPSVDIDLEVTLADIVREGGVSLFRELQQLEPYGMGNPAPQLLIRHCWLERRRGSATQAMGNQKVRYKKTRFMVRDDSTSVLFPGVWWGHDPDALPEGYCDVVVELEYGQLYKQPEYHLRLTAVRPAEENPSIEGQTSTEPWLLDWRQQEIEQSSSKVLRLDQCPNDWEELDLWAEQANDHQEKLALAYPASVLPETALKWQQLAGLAKYLARTQNRVTLAAVQERLALGGRSLSFGLEALKSVGFNFSLEGETIKMQGQPTSLSEAEATVATQAIQRFLNALAEEQFQHEYFQRAPVAQLQQTLEQRLTG